MSPGSFTRGRRLAADEKTPEEVANTIIHELKHAADSEQWTSSPEEWRALYRQEKDDFERAARAVAANLTPKVRLVIA